MVNNLPAMQETQVQFLGWEDPLKKEMAAHSNILVLVILWTEESGGLQSMGSQKNWHDCRLKTQHKQVLKFWILYKTSSSNHIAIFFSIYIWELSPTTK